MQVILKRISYKLWGSLKDLLPIILVIGVFQIFVIKQSFPNLEQLLVGLVCVVFGLMLFVEGLELGLFPVGENLAYALAKKGSIMWLMIFSFLLGFSTTIAEPSLLAVSREASKAYVESGLILATSQDSFVLGLRIAVAISVGLAILIGVLRIIKGWPLHYMIISGYILVMLMTIIAPKEIIGIAYDAGGVTTSTITVPLVTALGVGLASVLEGRNPLTDGFGLIAFASLMPMIFVMLYGLIIF